MLVTGRIDRAEGPARMGHFLLINASCSLGRRIQMFAKVEIWERIAAVTYQCGHFTSGPEKL